MPDRLPQRQTANLRRGRLSFAGASYFITFCTKNRVPFFRDPAPAQHSIQVLDTLHRAGDWDIWIATVMPDHVHVLFTLGSRLTLSQTIGKYKTLARRGTTAPMRWQENGFEHQLRSHEKPEDFGFYIFMNPYAARLAPINESWPWLYCPVPERFEFLNLCGPAQTPQPEWLQRAMILAETLPTGE